MKRSSVLMKAVSWGCRTVLSTLLIIVQLLRAVWRIREAALSRTWRRPGIENGRSGKKPASLKSVSLVVSQTQLREEDVDAVVKIIGWCVKMGMEYIFAYDPEGSLKRNRQTITEQIHEECPEISFRTESGWMQEGVCAPNDTEGLLMIRFLSREDALSPLLHAASNPSRSKENTIAGDGAGGYAGLKDVEQYWSSSLSMEDLRADIVSAFGKDAILEPDVLLVTGPVFSLAGCPPWHSRFSEIYFLGSLHSLELGRFCRILGKFWNTNQNFGS